MRDEGEMGERKMQGKAFCGSKDPNAPRGLANLLKQGVTRA